MADAAASAKGSVLSALRDARWIAGDRMRAYALGALGAYAAWTAISILRGFWLYDPDGHPVPGDFTAFWSAIRMAMAGQAAAAYDWAAHHAVQVAIVGAEFDGFFAWFNPPHFLLVLLPFGLMPHAVAWVAWGVVTGALYAMVFRQVLPVRGAWLIVLAAPATFLCFIAGQLGFLIAALMGAAMLVLDSRPVLAGASLALLTIKPQYGVLFPVLLLASGRFRVFMAAAAGTVLLIVASAAAFGTSAWIAFAGSLSGATHMMRSGGETWTKLQSLYACFYLVTQREGLAMALHWICAACIALLVTWLWRIPASPGVRGAAALAGAFLVTPRAYVYDATIVAMAAAFLAREIVVRGALPWERLLLCLAVMAPASFFFIGSFAAPAAMLTILALALRRAVAEREQGA